MTGRLTFPVEWKPLDGGFPEEQATFGAIGIRVDNVWLSVGRDKFTDTLTNMPLISGFYLAEWIAWNWWRLRWEPRRHSSSDEWGLAHEIASVGSGYIWPNVTIWSDGKRIRLAARPMPDDPSVMYHYVSDFDATIPSQEFERATDEFIKLTCDRMDSKNIRDSNLHALWRELQSDRNDPEIYRRRKLEALLGFGPQEAEPRVLDVLIDEATSLGESAIEELAAASMVSKQAGIAKRLENLARNHGFRISKANQFRFSSRLNLVSPDADTPAWVIGTEAAKTMRKEASLDDRPISNGKLCELAAVPRTALSHDTPLNRMPHHKMAFILDKDQMQRIVLRSKWETGRRFELTRLIGDQLVGQYGEQLCPATRTYTYRQQLQRAFAAELLSPFEAVEQALDGDYSDENQQLVAERFRVSPMVIRRQLVNNDRADQDGLEADGLRYAA